MRSFRPFLLIASTSLVVVGLLVFKTTNHKTPEGQDLDQILHDTRAYCEQYRITTGPCAKP